MAEYKVTYRIEASRETIVHANTPLDAIEKANEILREGSFPYPDDEGDITVAVSEENEYGYGNDIGIWSIALNQMQTDETHLQSDLTTAIDGVLCRFMRAKGIKNGDRTPDMMVRYGKIIDELTDYCCDAVTLTEEPTEE